MNATANGNGHASTTPRVSMTRLEFFRAAEIVRANAAEIKQACHSCNDLGTYLGGRLGKPINGHQARTILTAINVKPKDAFSRAARPKYTRRKGQDIATILSAIKDIYESLGGTSPVAFVDLCQRKGVVAKL